MKRLLFFSCFFLTGFLVSAQMTPRVNFYQINQAKKIKQGVRSGKLTPYEHKKLRMQQKLIQLQKTRIKADDRITKKERNRLRQNQQRAKIDIYAHIHD